MPRKTKQLAVRDEFLILTNGKRTEKNYFEAVRSNYKSIFKISVKFMNDDPVALVSHAILKRNDIKKSEAYQSGFLEGTVPMYDAYMALKTSLIRSHKEDE
mgnify:CR=1 FL=1